MPDNEDLRRIMEDRERDVDPVYECEECCEGIYDGEEYLDLRDLFGGCLCASCAEKLWKKA